MLQATHHAGMVHRDVKPGNVYLCNSGRVVLTDFGIACGIGHAAPATGPFRGSPPYLSPELLDGGQPAPTSDLYSLGATLFAAVEGRPPFGGDSLLATLAAIANDAPAPFLRAGPLRPVIEGLLARDPGRRMSAGRARAALQACLQRGTGVPRMAAGRQGYAKGSGPARSAAGRRVTGERATGRAGG